VVSKDCALPEPTRLCPRAEAILERHLIAYDILTFALTVNPCPITLPIP
jgi:hypothetical protein